MKAFVVWGSHFLLASAIGGRNSKMAKSERKCEIRMENLSSKQVDCYKTSKFNDN